MKQYTTRKKREGHRCGIKIERLSAGVFVFTISTQWKPLYTLYRIMDKEETLEMRAWLAKALAPKRKRERDSAVIRKIERRKKNGKQLRRIR